jgi:hypothetical protein
MAAWQMAAYDHISGFIAISRAIRHAVISDLKCHMQVGLIARWHE